MRLIKPILACALVAVLATGAFAASAKPAIFLDGGPTYLDDQDWEFIVKNNQTTAELAQGDWLVGMVAISGSYDFDDNITYAGPMSAENGPTFAAVFAIEVASVSTQQINGLWKYTFQPLDNSEWTTLQGLYSSIPSRNSSGTMLLAFDDPDGIDHADTDRDTSLGTAINGTALWEFGFNGDNGEFWSALVTDKAPPLPETIPASAALADFITFSRFASGLNVTYDPGVGILLHKHTTITFPTSLGPTLPVDWQLTGLFQEGSGPYFDLATDSNVYIVATPEPGSFALLGLGLAACGVYIRRRKARA